jgi:hypothetical protein
VIHTPIYQLRAPAAGIMSPRGPHETSDVPPGIYELGVPVAIVDMNDRGGSIRAVSGGGPSPRLLKWLLYDNPLSQREASTPFGLIRPLAGGP